VLPAMNPEKGHGKKRRQERALRIAGCAVSVLLGSALASWSVFLYVPSPWRGSIGAFNVALLCAVFATAGSLFLAVVRRRSPRAWIRLSLALSLWLIGHLGLTFPPSWLAKKIAAAHECPLVFGGFYMERPEELQAAFKTLDERLAQVTSGMTEEQVRETLGTPSEIGIPFRTPWHAESIFVAWCYAQDDAWGFIYFCEGKVVTSPLPPLYMPPFPDPRRSEPQRPSGRPSEGTGRKNELQDQRPDNAPAPDAPMPPPLRMPTDVCRSRARVGADAGDSSVGRTR